MTETKVVKEKPYKKTGRMLPILVGVSVKILLSVLILAGAGAVYHYQIRTSPHAGRKKPPRQAKLVRVIPVKKDNFTTTVTGMGPVIPAQQVTLRPQVTGQIVEVSPDVVPGGFVQAGQKLMAIDHRDYEILAKQRQSDVAKAVRDLKVEQGSQDVAKQEYKLLGEVITEQDRELVLREPQLAAAQAAKESTQAALQKARLDLIRCDVNVPFNAIVQQKHTDLGATVTNNSQLVTLIGTDKAWIEAKVWVHELKWLSIPERNSDKGSNVTIYNTRVWGENQFRIGRVVRLYGELETGGQMARLLVEVDDPFCLKPENRDQPQLLMGSFVRADIQGRTLTCVFPIDRSHVRGNDAVWIMDDTGKLDIRRVQIVFRSPYRVYVAEGLGENEQLVVTDIAAPVAGMPLRTAGVKDGSEQLDRMPGEEELRPPGEGER